MSKTAGWISPIVVIGGRIVGVWEIAGGELMVSLFGGEAKPLEKALQDEAARVANVRGTGSLSVRLV